MLRLLTPPDEANTACLFAGRCPDEGILIIFRSRETRSRPIEMWQRTNERTTKLCRITQRLSACSHAVSARKVETAIQDPRKKIVRDEASPEAVATLDIALTHSPDRRNTVTSPKSYVFLPIDHAAKAGRPSRAWPQTSGRPPSARTLLGSASP